MNPRVSRSSALASKATGYPIAKVAAKLAVGYTLDEIPNDLTGTTPASFEPTLDYVVVKFPRFAFEKFPGADRTLGTQMKSVGEAMGIGRTFAEAFLKAMRAASSTPAPRRRGDARRPARGPAPVVPRASSTDRAAARRGARPADAEARRPLRRRHRRRVGRTEDEVRAQRLQPASGPLPPRRLGRRRGRGASNYFYSTWGEVDEAAPRGDEPRVVILGSGPNRIGQGIEFDYCCVHAAQSFRALGYEAVMVNCNPETVSTDYDTSDRLYFEPLRVEEVLAVSSASSRRASCIQFGGQTPLKLARAIERGRLPDPRHAVRRGRPRRGPRALRPLLASARDPLPGVGDRVEPRTRRSRSPSGSATRCSCGPRTCSAAARCASATAPTRCARRSAGVSGAMLVDRFLENAIEIDVDARLRRRATPTSARSCSTSRRPASTPATPPACCRRRRCCRLDVR